MQNCQENSEEFLEADQEDIINSKRDPLFMWTRSIENLTRLRKGKHVRRAYKALLNSLDEKEFNGKLLDKQTADLIVPRSCYKQYESR